MNDLSLYREYREQMDTADLLTFDTEGFIPWAIQKWSPGSNHAGMVLHLEQYEGLEHRRWTLEATSHGPRLAFLSRLLEELHGECYWHQLNPEIVDLEMKRNAAGCWALSQQGVVKYDFKALLQYPFRKVSAEINKLVCSEYVQFSWAKGEIITMATGDAMSKPSDLPMLGVTLPGKLIVKHKPFIQVPSEFATVNP